MLRRISFVQTFTFLVTITFLSLIVSGCASQLSSTMPLGGQEISIVFNDQSLSSEGRLQPQFPPLVVVAGYVLAAATGIEFGWNCAGPVVNGIINDNGNISESTWWACIESGATAGAGKIAGKLILPNVKAVALRQAIKDQVGRRLTWEQLRRNINKSTKPIIANIAGDLLMNGFRFIADGITSALNQLGIPNKPGLSPQIGTITAQSKSFKLGVFSREIAYFNDADGDIVGIQINEFSSSGWRMIFGLSTEKLLYESNGSIGLNIQCQTTGTKKMRIILTDLGGRTGAKEFSYNCIK